MVRILCDVAFWRDESTYVTRWCFHRLFIFTGFLGMMIQFDEPMFQMDWFNYIIII